MYGGDTYKLAFDVNVIEVIQKEFGTVNEWISKTSLENGELNVSCIKYGFWAMTNEGINIDNEDQGLEKPNITLSKAGRIISSLGLENVALMISDLITKNFPSPKKNEAPSSKTKPKKKTQK